MFFCTISNCFKISNVKIVFNSNIVHIAINDIDSYKLLYLLLVHFYVMILNISMLDCVLGNKLLKDWSISKISNYKRVFNSSFGSLIRTSWVKYLDPGAYLNWDSVNAIHNVLCFLKKTFLPKTVLPKTLCFDCPSYNMFINDFQK